MRGSKIGVAGEMPFYIGIVSLGLAVCSFFLRGNKNSKNKESRFFMVLLIISLILADYPSVFIYYYVPLISFFKWPWRFLLPASLSIAYLTGTVTNTIYEKAKAFEISSTVVAYTDSDTFFIPYLEGIEDTGTDGSPGSETNTLTYTEDREVVIRVRNVGGTTPIQPFVTTNTITNTGMSQSVIRTEDTVYA